jgi:hypothetical protein
MPLPTTFFDLAFWGPSGPAAGGGFSFDANGSLLSTEGLYRPQPPGIALAQQVEMLPLTGGLFSVIPAFALILGDESGRTVTGMETSGLHLQMLESFASEQSASEASAMDGVFALQPSGFFSHSSGVAEDISGGFSVSLGHSLAGDTAASAAAQTESTGLFLTQIHRASESEASSDSWSFSGVAELTPGSLASEGLLHDPQTGGLYLLPVTALFLVDGARKGWAAVERFDDTDGMHKSGTGTFQSGDLLAADWTQEGLSASGERVTQNNSPRATQDSDIRIVQ